VVAVRDHDGQQLAYVYFDISRKRRAGDFKVGGISSFPVIVPEWHSRAGLGERAGLAQAV
jgi:hypothetical protein